MKVFITIVKSYIKIVLHYRASLMVSLIGEPISFMIHVALFRRIYEYNQADVMVGYDLSQMIWYFAGITFVWYCIWNNTDSNISNKILSGDLAIDLLRPVSIFNYELAVAVGGRTVSVMLELFPSIVIFSLIYAPRFLTLSSILKFMLIMLLSFFLLFLINFMIGLTAFRIKSNYSLQSVKLFIISLTAGAYIPLEFYPEWLNKIISFLPFQYLFYWPIQFFLNMETTRGIQPLIRVISLQLIWIVCLYVLTQLIWKRAIKKFCAVGG